MFTRHWGGALLVPLDGVAQAFAGSSSWESGAGPSSPGGATSSGDDRTLMGSGASDGEGICPG
jgi:hypothetical protein